MSDDEIRALERAVESDPDDVEARQALARAWERRTGLPLFGGTAPHRYEFIGSACCYCEAPDPRTKPGARARNPRARYGVRRFCEPGDRPDCFEVFDRTTGKCKSFGLYRYQAEESARFENAWHREHPSGKCEHAECPVTYESVKRRKV